jgi:hypothetical protein
MSAASSRFYPRAPRYTLKANDETTMRFALMQTRGAALDTELQNVSKSGLKFCIFNDEVPRRGLDEGDMIKIEFKIPSGKQIACFATVTRVEQVANWNPEFGDQSITEVAVSFRNLPTAFVNALERALPNKENEAQTKEISVNLFPTELNKRSLILFSLSSVALFSLFVFLSISPQQWTNWFTR